MLKTLHRLVLRGGAISNIAVQDTQDSEYALAYQTLGPALPFSTPVRLDGNVLKRWSGRFPRASYPLLRPKIPGARWSEAAVLVLVRDGETACRWTTTGPLSLLLEALDDIATVIIREDGFPTSRSSRLMLR